MDSTARLALPLLSAAQLQKETWHNEALLRLDALFCGSVAGGEVAEPPESPIEGRWFRIGQGATGAWQGRDGQLALFTAGGWRFLEPFEGLEFSDEADGVRWRFNSGAWTKGELRGERLLVGDVPVVGQRQPDVAAPTGGSTVDLEARAAIRDLLTAIRAHGLIG